MNANINGISYDESFEVINVIAKDLNNDTYVDIIVSYVDSSNVVNHDFYLYNAANLAMQPNSFKISNSGILVADVDRDRM